MTEADPITEHRGFLFGVAYRMLGSVADAEDAVQETFLRWHRAQAAGEELRHPKAWLSTVVGRIALDQLTSARATRERYVGPWLPEPLLGTAGSEPDVAEQAVLADSLSTAFLVLLETLTPKERAAFLLHDVFGYDFAAIAGIVGESEAYCRQIARRARSHVAAGRPRFPATPEQQARLADGFLHAVVDGDLPALIETLAEDVTIWSDGGGKALAARKPVIGREKAATFLINLRRMASPDVTWRQTVVNGQPGIVTLRGGEPFNVVTFEFAEGAISRIFIVVNPDKLGAVAS